MRKASTFIALLFIPFLASLSAQEKAGAPRKGPLRIVCLGDSITEGFGLKDPSKTYPKQLGKLLGEKARVDGYGAGGTSYLNKAAHPFQKAAWTGYVEAWKPEVVVLAFGTNCSHPGNWKHKAEYVKDIENLIEKVERAAGGSPRFYVCLPPPAFSDKWSISDKTMRDEIIPKLKKFAEEKKYGVVDLRTPLLKKAALFPDTIHPNEEGMTVIAETLSKELKKLLPVK